MKTHRKNREDVVESWIVLVFFVWIASYVYRSNYFSTNLVIDLCLGRKYYMCWWVEWIGYERYMELTATYLLKSLLTIRILLLCFQGELLCNCEPDVLTIPKTTYELIIRKSRSAIYGLRLRVALRFTSHDSWNC